MVNCLFSFILIALSCTLTAQEQIKNSAHQNAVRAPQIMKIRESTLMQGDYLITLYKLIKQIGTNFIEVPDTAFLIIETPERLGRGNVTVLFNFESGYKTAHIQEISISKDYKAIIQTIQNYIRQRLACNHMVWHLNPSDAQLLTVCKELGIQTATRTIPTEQLFNAATALEKSLS